MTVINTQRLSAVVRQILAILSITFGVLTQSVTTLHLPASLSAILLVAGSVILAIEHYVSDPSTGPNSIIPIITPAPTPNPIITPIVTPSPSPSPLPPIVPPTAQ